VKGEKGKKRGKEERGKKGRGYAQYIVQWTPKSIVAM